MIELHWSLVVTAVLINLIIGFVVGVSFENSNR